MNLFLRELYNHRIAIIDFPEPDILIGQKLLEVAEGISPVHENAHSFSTRRLAISHRGRNQRTVMVALPGIYRSHNRFLLSTNVIDSLFYFHCPLFFRLLAQPGQIELDELLQSERLHIIVINHVDAEVEQILAVLLL